ncbi:hypothetical protein PAPYR_3194 [Paratrimastix pyriformis]|uniref:DUF985 domain-containing protein n=1 Tax=Paratrimastix pyriformis TaxID=342808 RepID=A0ABQ8US56_9EUKA|nr:hypothetical protein PAPYR_3194 [Paratrimastix pyriformis]
MLTQHDAEGLVARYQMDPHPEGGFYKQLYLGQTEGQPDGRPMFSTIIYLMEKGKMSAFHSVTMDELWNYHSGLPVVIVELLPEGKTRESILGCGVGQVPQIVMRAGSMFGAYPLDDHSGSDYSFLGCVCVPAFRFSDWNMPPRATLLAMYPQPEARAIIEKLTYP